MSDIQTLEEWMLTTITHPHGVRAGAVEAARTAATPSLTSVVHATADWSAEARLGVYWNAYFARLQDCLREEFPVVRQTVGDDVFDEFAFDYLPSHPSTSYTLGRLGAQFPAFLTGSRPPRDGDDPDWADFLADLADFEWTLSEVFDGPGLEHVAARTVSGLDGIPPNQLLEATVISTPSLRLAAYRFPVHTYHAAMKSGALPEVPEPQPSFVAVTRNSFTVQHYALAEDEYSLLRRLLAGDTLGCALETVCGDDDALLAEVGTHIASWFNAWTRAGFLISLCVSDRP